MLGVQAVSISNPELGSGPELVRGNPAVDGHPSIMEARCGGNPVRGIESQSARYTIGIPVQTHVEFRSDRFPAYDGEEEQINPGLWGKRLAEFLRDNLRTEGFETEEPIAED